MKFIVRLIKYTIFSAAVSLATCLIALFLGIFFLLNRNSQPGFNSDALPPALQKLVAQDFKYQRAIDQLKFIEEIEDEARKSSLSSICERICDPPRFKMGHLDFNSFYQAEGRASFEDVDFRLQLESFLLVKRLLPAELIRVVSDISDFNALGKSTSEMLSATLRIEAQVIRELFLAGRRLPALKLQNEKLSAVKKMRNQCEQRPVDDIKASCKAPAAALEL